MLGITTLVCTPLSAAGRAYGVICADRGGGRFELSDGERHLLWTLGKTAALVATARNATRQQERARRLGRAAGPGARDPRARAAAPVRRVAGAGSRSGAGPGRARALPRGDAGGGGATCAGRSNARLAPLPPETGTTLAAELERLTGTPGAPVYVRLAVGRSGAGRPRAARAVGAGRGDAKRRQARQRHRGSTSPSPATATRSRWRSATTALAADARDAGMGLRLAAFEALQQGGVVEFGPTGEGGWRVRLVVAARAGGARDGGSGAPRRAPASARRRRPRRRALGLSRAARRAALGRALPRGAHGRGGDRADADVQAARGAGRPVPRRGVRRGPVRVDPRGFAVDPGAADLRRRADVAGGRPRSGRVGLRLKGLGGARGRLGRAAWSEWG